MCWRRKGFPSSDRQTSGNWSMVLFRVGQNPQVRIGQSVTGYQCRLRSPGGCFVSPTSRHWWVRSKCQRNCWNPYIGARFGSFGSDSDIWQHVLISWIWQSNVRHRPRRHELSYWASASLKKQMNEFNRYWYTVPGHSLCVDLFQSLSWTNLTLH